MCNNFVSAVFAQFPALFAFGIASVCRSASGFFVSTAVLLLSRFSFNSSSVKRTNLLLLCVLIIRNTASFPHVCMWHIVQLYSHVLNASLPGSQAASFSRRSCPPSPCLPAIRASDLICLRSVSFSLLFGSVFPAIALLSCC